jgi:hypothetical protein
MTQQLSFSEFMKHLVALFSEKGIPLPLKDERPGHGLFYDLKRNNPAAVTLPFLLDLRFDWDGQYPKCQEVSEFLHALHWNAGVSAINPRYTNMTLPEEIARLWNERRSQLDPDTEEMLNAVAEHARDEFAQC